MRTASCSGWRNEWHHNTTYGLVGIVVAAVLLVLMRHDLIQGLSFAVIIVSAAGWTRRRRPDETAGEAER